MLKGRLDSQEGAWSGWCGERKGKESSMLHEPNLNCPSFSTSVLCGDTFSSDIRSLQFTCVLAKAIPADTYEVETCDPVPPVNQELHSAFKIRDLRLRGIAFSNNILTIF